MKKIIPKADCGSCPVCGSALTGRIKSGRGGRYAFHFGSPVMYRNDPRGRNCVCFSCGVEWEGEVKPVLIDSQELAALYEEWSESEYPTSSLTNRDQEYILDEMCDDLGLLPVGKRQQRIRKKRTGQNVKKAKGPVRRYISYLAKDILLGPFNAAKNVYRDIAGSGDAEEDTDDERAEDEPEE